MVPKGDFDPSRIDGGTSWRQVREASQHSHFVMEHKSKDLGVHRDNDRRKSSLGERRPVDGLYNATELVRQVEPVGCVASS